METDEQSKWLDLAKKQIGKPVELTKNYIPIGSDQKLYVQCQQWESGQKFVSIFKCKSSWPKPKYLPDILVPQGAYKFMAAMDGVIHQLSTDEPTHPEDDELILANQTVEGDPHYDFEFSAWHQKGDKWYFNIRCVPTSDEHKEQTMYFPFSALQWLRQQIVEILVEHDGTERIDEMPTIPEWATREKVEGDDTKNKEGNGQSQSGMKSEMEQPKALEQAKTFVPLGRDRQIRIKCDQGRSGQKTIEISLIMPELSTTPYLPKILVPQGAYIFMEAMDGLIGQLRVVKTPTNTPSSALGKNSLRSILASQMADCENRNNKGFKLSVVWNEKDGEWNLYIHSMPISEKYKKREVHFPLWALPQLRQEIVKMLAEHDGSEHIDEMPTMPEWTKQATPKIEQQEQQPNLEPEKVKEKKADDTDEDEDCPCCTKEEKCWRHAH